jgi:hypothetical protein
MVLQGDGVGDEAFVVELQNGLVDALVDAGVKIPRLERA